MTNRKKGQAMVYQTLHRKLKIVQLELQVKSGAPEGYAVSTPLYNGTRRVTLANDPEIE